MTPPLARHLEMYLGAIAGGWEGEAPIKVVRFCDQPELGVLTYVTMGLSRRVLPMPNGRKVRQELLISAQGRFDAGDVASLLMSLGEYIAGQGQALLRGDVIGPSDPIVEGVQLNALYASIPVFFPDDFATFHETSPPTVMVWLIPLHPSEARFVKTHGWDRFEDHLESAEVDFWDLERLPLALSPSG